MSKRLCWYCEKTIMDAAGNGEWRVMSSAHVAPDDEGAYPARTVAVCLECADTCHRCGQQANHDQTGGICNPEFG